MWLYVEYEKTYLFIKNCFSCDNCRYISQQEGTKQTNNETMNQSWAKTLPVGIPEGYAFLFPSRGWEMYFYVSNNGKFNSDIYRA